MPLLSGSLRHCHWNLITPPDGVDTWDEFVENMLGIANRVEPGDVVIDFWHDVGTPGADQRARFGRAFEQSPKIHLVKAHAFVATSMLSRGALTAINWMVKRPFEEKAFQRPDAAYTWLNARQPDLDIEALKADLDRAAPFFKDLSW